MLLTLLGGGALLAPSARAAQDASFPAPLESIRVDGDGAATFHSQLDQGGLYLLKASGVAGAVDAEYDIHGKDVISGRDVGLDVTPRTLRNTTGAHPTRMKWTGKYRADHTYYMVLTGDGGPISLKLVPSPHQPGNPANTAISVSLYRLSTLPTPLETLQTPLLQKIVPTVMTTRKSTIYLLQASGQGRVGGGGLGMGDAEYMDYRADGVGQVDVGDGNTDYGLGVDESDLSKTPHALWWGPWRADHTYDMLFEGTGKPIQFMFYDVAGGYGDNSPTDTLTVKIYALP